MYKNKQTIIDITKRENILFLDFGFFNFFIDFSKPTTDIIMAIKESTPITVEII